MHYVHQDGSQVFKYAVRRMAQLSCHLLERNGFTKNDLALVVPHQANARILDGIARKLGVAPEKIVVTLQRHGNTSAASIPLALNQAFEEHRVKDGSLVLMEAMGGGFTWGAVLARW